MAAVCAAVPVLIALVRVVEYLTSLDLAVDHWFFEVGHETLGLAPVGKMSLFSAIMFLVSGLTIELLILKRSAPCPRPGGDGGVGGDRDRRDLPAGVPVRCAAALRRQDDPDGGEHGARLCLSGSGDRRRGRR